MSELDGIGATPALQEWQTTQLVDCPGCDEAMPTPPYLDYLRHQCEPRPHWTTNVRFEGLVIEWPEFVEMVKRKGPGEYHHFNPPGGCR